MGRWLGGRAGFGLFGAVLSCFLSSPSTQAGDENLFLSYFAGPNAKACYLRAYPPKHLKAHPRQKVHKIMVTEVSEGRDAYSGPQYPFELKIGIQTAASTSWFTGIAYCETSGAKAQCHIEGDGGAFVLKGKGASSLRLETGGMVFEGDVFESVGGGESDGNVFILPKTKRSACAGIN